MAEYHPDPDLLDQLATMWFEKADDVDRLRAIAPSRLGGTNWTGVTHTAAEQLANKVSMQLGNTSELLRRWGRKLQKMAQKVRDELAQEAKNTLLMILGTIFGLFAGLFVGFALGPAIAALAEAIAVAIAGAAEIATSVLTLVFEFTIGALAFGSMQFTMDMFAEALASAVTSTPFELNASEWQNVLIAALTGGLFSLSGASLASLRTLPFRGRNEPKPPVTNPVTAHPNTEGGLGNVGVTPVNSPGSSAFNLSTTSELTPSAAVVGNLGRPSPATAAPATANLGKGEANLAAVPRVVPETEVSASSLTRTSPVGGSAGTRTAVPTEVQVSTVEGANVAVPKAPEVRPGTGDVANPSTITSPKPVAGLDRGASPQTVDNPPVQPAAGPSSKTPAAPNPVEAAPQGRTGAPEANPPASPTAPSVQEANPAEIGAHSEPPPAASRLTTDPSVGHPATKIDAGTQPKVEAVSPPTPKTVDTVPHDNPVASVPKPPRAPEAAEAVVHNGPDPAARPVSQPATPHNEIATPKNPEAADPATAAKPPTGPETAGGAKNPPTETDSITAPKVTAPAEKPLARTAEADSIAAVKVTAPGGKPLAHAADPEAGAGQVRAPDTAVSSRQPAPTEGGSTGRPAPPEHAPQEAGPVPVPKRPEPGGAQGAPGAGGGNGPREPRTEAWGGPQRNLLTGLREKIGVARGIDGVHPDLDGDFAAAVKAHGDGLPKEQAARLLADFRNGASEKFGQAMDKAFAGERPPTGAEKGAWAKTYAQVLDGLRGDIRAEVGAGKVDAAAVRLKTKFGGGDEPPPQVGHALDAWTKDANGLVARAGRSGKWDGVDGDLRSLEDRFEHYLTAQRGADAAGARAAERFDHVLASRDAAIARGGETPPRADVDRIAALRVELRTAARDAYLARSEAKSVFDRGTPSADSLDRQAAQWLRNRDTLIHVRLNYLDRTQTALDEAEARIRTGDPGRASEDAALMAKADGLVDGGSGNFAAPTRPQPAYASVGDVRRLVAEAPQRTSFGTRAGDIFAAATDRIRIEAKAGEGDAFKLAFDHVGTADRVATAAERRLADAFATQLERLERDGFQPANVERTLNLLRTVADRIAGGVRRGAFNDAVLQSAEHEAERMIAAELSGPGRSFGPGTADRLLGDFKVDAVHQYRALFGEGRAGKLDVADWLGTRPAAEPAGDRALIERLYPDDSASSAGVRPAPRPDPDSDGDAVSLSSSVGGKSDRDVVSLSSLASGSGGGPHDLQILRMEVDTPAIDPLHGIGKSGEPFGGPPPRGDLQPAKGEPPRFITDPPAAKPGLSDEIRSGTEARSASEARSGSEVRSDSEVPSGSEVRSGSDVPSSSQVRSGSEVRQASDVRPEAEVTPGVTGDGSVRSAEPSGRPPAYEEALDGDKLPEYETARLDPPPGVSQADILRYLAENRAAERTLRAPEPLGGPMSGVDREIDRIQAERRDGVAQQVEDLGRVGKTDAARPGGRFDEPDPAAAVDPRPSAREMAWNAMAKYEAQLRSTLGDGVRPGDEGGRFADGRPDRPRTGQAIADDLRRFMNGSPDEPAPDAGAVRQRVQDLDNVELDRANSWLRNNQGGNWDAAREQIAREWQARYEGGDLTPGIGTMSPHEAARRLTAPTAERAEPDVEALRAGYRAKAGTARDLEAARDRIVAEQVAVRSAIRRQYLGGEARPGEARPGLGDIATRAAELNRLGIELTPERLAADPHVVEAADRLAEIAAERTVLATARTGLDKAIVAAERQATELFGGRDGGPEAAARFAGARDDLERLTTVRDRGLSGAAPRPTPVQQALYQQFERLGGTPAAGPRFAPDPARIGPDVLSLMDELERAAARLGHLGTPQPEDPEWLAAHPGTRGDRVVAEWLDAYGAVHNRWNSLPSWLRQGFDRRDTALRHFQLTAQFQREDALLGAILPAVRGAEAEASRVAELTRLELARAIRTPEPSRPPEVGEHTGHDTPPTLSVRDGARPVEVSDAARPAEMPDAARPVEMPDAARPVEMPDAARPVEMPDAARPVEAETATSAETVAETSPETLPPDIAPPEAVPLRAVPPDASRNPAETPSASETEAAAQRERPAGTESTMPVVPPVGGLSVEERFAALRVSRLEVPAIPAASEPVGSSSETPSAAETEAVARRERPAGTESTTPVVPPVGGLSVEERFAALRVPHPEAPAPSETDGTSSEPPTEAVAPPAEAETPPAGAVTPPAEAEAASVGEEPEPVGGGSIRFNDPERQDAWQRARQSLVAGLIGRLGSAAAVDRIVPGLESDFVRAWHATPGGSDFTEVQLVEQFEKFGGAATRAFDESLTAAFDEVRAPTPEEELGWRERYDDLLRDLADDLRAQVGHNEIDAAAARTFDRWRAEDSELVGDYNQALRHWTEDTVRILDSFRATRTWEHAPAALGQRVARLDTYRAIHLGAHRAALRVGDRFDEIVAGRRAALAASERVAAARAEAMAAAYDRYVRWWRPSRIGRAADDLAGLVGRADLRFGEFTDAIRTRLDYLDETQPTLDWAARMTEPEMMPKSWRDGLDEAQLLAVGRIVRREAESVVDRRATPFVADPPVVTESMLKGVRREVIALRDQIPVRAAFAARAAEITRAALDRIDLDAAAGAAEALSHGLDPAAALGRVPSDARTAVFGLVHDVRERLAERAYPETELASSLAALANQVAKAVERVRVDTIRDALLRRGDAEAVEVLNEHAAEFGAMLGAPVRERVYGDFERDFVRQFHTLFADGTDFDVAAWLRRTPPEPDLVRAVEDGPPVRLLPAPAPGVETDSAALGELLGGLPVPGERLDPAARQQLRLGVLPEPERADWNQRFEDAAADADRAVADDALTERMLEVYSTRLTNDTALAELVSGARQAWAAHGPGRVRPAEFGPLVARFQESTSDLGPRSAGTPRDFPEIPATEPLPPAPATEPVTHEELTAQLGRLSPPEPASYGDEFEQRLGRKLEGWFKDAAQPLPYRIREKFWIEFLTVREKPDRSAAVRQAMVAAAEAERAKLPIEQRHPELTPHAAEQFAKRIEDAGSLADIARIEQEAAEAAAIRPRATVAVPNRAAPKPEAPLDDFDQKYEIVPKTERDRFRREIVQAGTPERLEQAYAGLDARRAELLAAAESATQPSFEEQLTLLGKFLPRYGYRVVKADTPTITRAQAAAYDREAAQFSTVEEAEAFEERLRQDGYLREPGEADEALTAARVAGLPGVPMQHQDLVAMFRRWADQEGHGSGVDQTVPATAVAAIDEALAAADGTALHQAVTEFEEAVFAARVKGLKPAGPTASTPAPKPTESPKPPETPAAEPADTLTTNPAEGPADTSTTDAEDVAAELERLRAELLAEVDPAEAALRDRLADPTLQPPATTPQPPAAPRSLEALRRQMPDIPTQAPRAPAPSDGPATTPHTPDPNGFDEEIRRMAEAEGRVGTRGGADPDADLAKRLRKLHETPTTPVGPEPAGAAPKAPEVPPAPVVSGLHGRVEVEAIQADGTVVARTGPAEPAASALAHARQQLAEIDELHAETEAAYDSYLALERDLRARQEDLAARFAAKVEQWRADQPELAAYLGKAELDRLEQGIAELAARHFRTVRAVLPQAADQRTMIAGLIAEQVEALGPKLAAAARPPHPDSRVDERPPTRVEELSGERFDSVAGAFRRTDLFGGRYLGAEDYDRLRAEFLDRGRAAAPTTADDWLPTAEWASIMDSAGQRLAGEMAVLSAGNRWFRRIADAVAYDRGEDPGEATRLPQEGWYHRQFQTRLAAGYTQIWSALPAGRLASGAAYLEGLSATPDRAETPAWAAWRQSFADGLDWLRDQLTFAYDMQSVLVTAAGEFRRLVTAGGADANTAAALASAFRRDRIRDHLTGRGLPPDALDAWLDREKADTDVFGASLAARAEAQQARPAEFAVRATQVTDALITEYTPRVATAGEVAQRKPDFATLFSEEVRAAGTRTAELAEAFRRDAPDEDLADAEARFRTLDALDPADRADWGDRVADELTQLHHQVWRYAIQVGAAVDSEHWQAAAERWAELSTQYWTDLRIAALRQTQTGRLAPALDELRAGATAAELTPADADAVVAAFTKDATAAIERLLHSKPFDPGRLRRWAELESELLDSVPRYLTAGRARAAEAARTAEAFRARTAGSELSPEERDARAAEVEAAARAAFDLAYRQFRWADDDQRLTQAEHAGARQRDALVDRVAARPPAEAARSAEPTGEQRVRELAEESRRKLVEQRLAAGPAELAALYRIGAEIEAVISAAERDVEAEWLPAGLAERALDKARARLGDILGSVRERLADEGRLGAALAAATGKFDTLPGADRLNADDPLRYRFLDELAGKAAAGIAHLTRSAQSAAVTGEIRASAALARPLPATLPPVELTPLATPPPAAPPAEPATAPAAPVHPDAAFRAGLYDRLGSVPAPDAVDAFGDGPAGEQAAVHWSLQTLAHHGREWLDRGVAFLDEADPAARERLLVDAVREAPADSLLAFSRLIRGVAADPERDLPISVALRAAHLALAGDAETAATLMRTTWRNAFPSREALIGALAGRSASGAERAALAGLGVALVTC